MTKRLLFLRCFCNLRLTTCTLLSIIISFSCLFSWGLAFIAGLLSTMDTVENLRDVQRNATQLSLQRLLLQPHHAVLAAHYASIASNVTLDTMGRLDSAKKEIHRVLGPIARQYTPLLPGMQLNVGTEDGHLYRNDLIGPVAGKPGSFQHIWVSQYCEPDRTNCLVDADTVTIHDYHNLDIEINHSETLPFPLDIKNRPWYIATKERKQPLISTPAMLDYFFRIGLYYTHPTYNANGELLGIWALGYFLDEFSDFLEHFPVGKSGNGHLFVTDRKGLVIGSSNSNETFVNDDGNNEQYKAIDLTNHQQRRAAQIIDSKWGFDKVENGMSEVFFGTLVFDVILLEVSFNNISLLESDAWICVIITPFFDDYFTLLTWLNVGSICATFILGMIAALLVIIWFTCCITIPLQSLGKKMELIQEMDLENIHLGKKAILQEIYSIQQSFEFTIRKLKEYRAFLPTYLFENEETEAETENITKSTLPSEAKSLGSSRNSSEQVGIQQDRHSKFSNLLSFQLVHLIVIQITNFDDIFGLKISQQNQYLQIYESAIDTIKQCASKGGGMLESFDQEKFIFSYRTDLSVVLSTMGNVLRQLKLKFTNWNQSNLHCKPKFGISCVSGDIVSGVIGSPNIKKKILFGQILDQGISLADKNKFWKSTNILCSESVVMTLKQYGVRWVYRNIEDGIYEIIERTEIESDEWLYEMNQRRLKERFAPYAKGYKLMKNNDFAGAIVQFKNFLEECPDDFPCKYYYRHCVQQLEET